MTPAPRWNTVHPFFEFSLLGLLTSGYLAVAGSGYLDAATALLTALGLIARALLVAGVIRISISPRLVNAGTLAYTGFYPLDYLYVSRDFLTATVHLVFFVAVVRILSASSDRDYFQVKIIAFLELLAASILSTSANYFLFLTLFLLFGVATFASSEIRRSAHTSDAVVRGGQRRFHLRLTALTLFTVGGILTITAGLFFILPRTARAAFQRFVPQRYHLPGFSNEVTLGQIGELKMSSAPVMHARILLGGIEGRSPLPLKWRGAALSQFDGKRWFNEKNTSEVLRVEGGILRLVSLDDTLRQGHQRLFYEISMQETASDALFIAGSPEAIQIFVPLVIRTPTDAFRLFGPGEHLRYRAQSLLETDGDPHYRNQPLAPSVRATHLQLTKLDPRVKELAQQIIAGSTSDSQSARRLEAWLRRAFPYTTELPQVEAADPIADFLFQRKKGHCEYFASALAVMLRSVGIPSRVATGFQSGTFNPISGWYLIQSSDAHSWVEAWLDGKGWTTLDPTPPDNSPPGFSLTTRLHLYVDAMQVFWQDWVLSYDIERQLNLAAKMEQSSRGFSLKWLDGSWSSLTARWKQAADVAKLHGANAVVWIVVVTLVLIYGPRLWRHGLVNWRFRRLKSGLASASDATLLYRRFLFLLHKKGVEKPAWLTPLEFARNVKDEHAAPLVWEFTMLYNDLRFGQKQEAAPRMLNLLERIQQMKLPRKK